MSLFEDTNPRALKELLADVHSRTMVLPDFQRDVVWEPGATQELVVSIASNCFKVAVDLETPVETAA